MNRIFVISDTHFGHKKVIEFEAVLRPFATIEEHDAELVRRWNSVVGSKDTVWHLGDVLFGEKSFEILGHLNGIKRLVMGNHDRYPTEKYLRYFTKVLGSAEIHGCLFTHIPIHPDQFRRYRLNVHGHLHSKKMDDPRYINVSAEHWDLTPTRLDELLHNVELSGAEKT